MALGFAFSGAIKSVVLYVFKGKEKGRKQRKSKLRWWCGSGGGNKLVFIIWRNPPSLFSTVSITLAFNLIFNGVFLSKILSLSLSLSNVMYLKLLYAIDLHMLTNYWVYAYECYCHPSTCLIYQNALRRDLGVLMEISLVSPLFDWEKEKLVYVYD